MIDFARLTKAAFKAELSASRRLERERTMSAEDALRQTLESVAGAAGLAALLAQRAAHGKAAEERLAARDERKVEALARKRERHAGPPTPWRAWFDGSAHPNPGRCGIGALLTGPAGERIEISRPAGYGNSSEAEYRALIAVLEAALGAGAQGLTVYGDSQVVINDVNGPDQDAAPSLRAYRTDARALMAELHGVILRWLPRHKNPEADALSQRGVLNFTD